MDEREHVGRISETKASDLLSKAQEGKLSAFEKLVERHRDDVYSLGLQVTRCETCALDIAQQSFLSAYQHLNQFRTEEEFGAWVQRLAAGLAMLQPRKVAPAVKDAPRSRELNTRRGADHGPTDRSRGNDEEPLSAELRQAIQGAMDQLPRDQREVVVFRDLAALSDEQIAEITGQSIRVIKDRLHQARLSLSVAIDRCQRSGSLGCA